MGSCHPCSRRPQKIMPRSCRFYMGLRRPIVAATWVAIVSPLAGGRIALADESPRFNRDIRPILADRCYACHGPDSGTRKAELRLDTEEGAHESVIVPGDADSSEVVARVSSDDPEVRMPPPASKKPPLSAEQIDL